MKQSPKAGLVIMMVVCISLTTVTVAFAGNSNEDATKAQITEFFKKYIDTYNAKDFDKIPTFFTPDGKIFIYEERKVMPILKAVPVMKKKWTASKTESTRFFNWKFSSDTVTVDATYGINVRGNRFDIKKRITLVPSNDGHLIQLEKNR